MNLRQFPFAEEWLNSFPSKTDKGRIYSDRSIAEDLLNELQIVSTDDVRRGISNALEVMLQTEKIDSRIFYCDVISSREIPPPLEANHALKIKRQKEEAEQRFKQWKREHQGNEKAKITLQNVSPFSSNDLLRYLRSKHDVDASAPSFFQHVAFETFLPNQPSLNKSEDPFGSVPGSEAITANLLGKLFVEKESHFLAPSSSQEEVIENARTILLVADFSGTGVQVVEYAKTFHANERIREKRNQKRLKIVLICYAATLLAEKWIKENQYLFDEISIVKGAHSLSALDWDSLKKKELKDFLESYSLNKKSRRRAAFGFERSGALYCSSFSIPNNLPVVLRQPLGPTSNWSPLLTHQNIQKIEGHGTGDAIRATTLIGTHPDFNNGPSLAAAKKSPYFQRLLGDLEILLLLYLSEARECSMPSVNEISSKLRLEIAEVESRLETLRGGGFIDLSFSLTDAGRAELEKAKKKQYQKKYSLHKSLNLYYPSSLRLGEKW